MPCYAVQPSPDSFIPSVWGRGGEVISADLKKALFNGPEGIAALTFDVNNIKSKAAYVSKGFDWQNDFGAKKVPMSPPTTKPAWALTTYATGLRPRWPVRLPAACTSPACSSRLTAAETVGFERLVALAICIRI